MSQSDVLYNVVCRGCGSVWAPSVKSPLWWQAKQRDAKGFLDALVVTPQQCGCQSEVLEPDAPYRVIGYDDMCSAFDMPFTSLVQAARKYLELARYGAYVVFFVDKRTDGGKRSRVKARLEELARI